MALTLTTSTTLFTGYSMPLLGLGVYRNDDCVPACLAALKHGYRMIDSARMYKNEAQVGQALRESGVPRSEVFIISKVNGEEHGYETTLRAVDDSLANFGFDYIDLYLIHSPLSGKEKRVAAYRALVDAKKAGKLRSIGVSNYNIKHLEEIREAGLETPSVNQLELQPFCQQKPIVDYCAAHGIFVQAYCPLVRADFGDATLQDVARKHGKEVPQILVRWSLQRGFSPLPKSSQPARVVSNAQVFDFALDAEDMARIDALDRGSAGAISWNPVDAE